MPQCTAGRSSRKVRVVSDAEQEDQDKAVTSAPQEKLQEKDVTSSGTRKKKRRADSSDFIASAVTRRFGYVTARTRLTSELPDKCAFFISRLFHSLQIGWRTSMGWRSDIWCGV